jgi:hypothetical protein
VFFFLAITATSFAVTLLSTTFARKKAGFAERAARVSRLAGWIFSAACLLYLTLWWRNANAGFGWAAPVWTAFALGVDVTISLLLGHAQRITTLAVLAAAAGPAASLPPVGPRSWRLVFAGGALAFVGAAALLVTTAAAESPTGPDHPPLSVVHSQPLRVIAIDGFDPAMYDGFASRLAERTWGTRVRLQAQDTSDPARAWTTIATGEPPAVHGVRGIETRRVAGVQGSLAMDGGTIARTVRAATDLVRLTRPSVASRDERRSKTAWEVGEEAGLRTAVVNWWATWPAPPGTGIVITDRAVLRLEHGGVLDGEIAPPALYEELRAAWPDIRARARAAAAGQFNAVADARTGAVLRRSAELDATIVGLFLSLSGPARDLDMIYLPGLDIAQHALLATEGAAQTPSSIAARVEGLRSYYGFLRDVAEPLMMPAGRTSVVIVTQPGRVQTPADGVLALYAVPNVDVASGIRDGGVARVEDIVPTLLHTLGVPLSRELAGNVVKGWFAATGAPRFVDSYGRPFAAPASGAGRPLDQEMIDRLRSLGYVK